MILLISLAILGIYLTWKYFPQGKLVIKDDTLSVDVDLFINENTSCSHWIVGVQAEMFAHHYQSEEAFYNRLNDHLKPIKEKCKHTGKSVIVFPEHIGTWLIAAEEKNSVYTAGKASSAFLPVVLSRPIRFLKYKLAGLDAPDSTQASLFLLKAEKTVKIYQNVFSRLAKEYNAYIIAGSILLPSPKVENGKIKISGNELYNNSFIFLPDGSAANEITKKIFPVIDERKFCSTATLDDLKVHKSEAGNISTLICADSWYPEHYTKINSLNTTILAVPSYVTGKTMKDRWKGYGYHGATPPENVNLEDVGNIAELEAWNKYAISGRISPNTIGVNVFLRGQLWDMKGDGQSKIVFKGKDHETKSNGAALLVFCPPKKNAMPTEPKSNT